MYSCLELCTTVASKQPRTERAPSVTLYLQINHVTSQVFGNMNLGNLTLQERFFPARLFIRCLL